jgi:myo-inositol-1(or 4)-monophosphatase
MDLELNAAISVALTGGRYIAENYGTKLNIESKSNDQDLVTNVDKGSQNIIASLLKASFPDIGLYGEEDLNDEEGKKRWIIDALDGTTNFIHGVPFFCVSLALETEGKLAIGVIYDPMRNELFHAKRGQGAFLNGGKITVTKTQWVRESLLATGFPYDMYSPDNNLDHFGRFKMIAQEVRALGAAALELAYVACGRLDGYWETGLFPWDTAAGVIILEEAGGTITGKGGEPFLLKDDFIVTSNGKIHEEMLQILNRKF